MTIEKPAHVICRFCGIKMMEKLHFDYWNYECPICHNGIAICKKTEVELEEKYEKVWSQYRA